MQKTVLILAGGKGQRFHSRDKCFIMLDGKPLIQRAIDNLWSAADELIVAARDEQQGARISTTIPDKIVLVFDPLKGFGPLAGVLSGLERSSSSFSLIVGCDMPFVNKAVVEFLFAVAERGDYDAVVPRWENGMVEPLHAVYKREAMLTAVREAIEHGDKKMFNVLSQLKNVKFISVNEIREITPELTTFRNINTPEELEKFAALTRRKD
jgi:molybdopterin-guanine dinucleotide biosynthesis protein A